MSARPRVAVLFGGRSGEHEVSLRSAASVAGGLAECHDVLCVLIDKAGRWRLQDGPRPRPTGGEPVFLAPDPTDGGALWELLKAAESMMFASPEARVAHGQRMADALNGGARRLLERSVKVEACLREFAWHSPGHRNLDRIRREALALVTPATGESKPEESTR